MSASSSPVSFASGSSDLKHRTVIIGAGFLASYITRQLVGVSSSNEVLLASRRPDARYNELKHLGRQVLAPASGVDIARPGSGAASLESVLEGAGTVINLVGCVPAPRRHREARSAELQELTRLRVLPTPVPPQHHARHARDLRPGPVARSRERECKTLQRRPSSLLDELTRLPLPQVARASQRVGAKLIHVSAIGANPNSAID